MLPQNNNLINLAKLKTIYELRGRLLSIYEVLH